MPGSVMAMGRLNRPAIMVYGGSIHSGKWKGESLNIVSAFEALGKFNNTITPEDFRSYSKRMPWSRCLRRNVYS
jgi:dihydroxy-acid dehydratase